MNMYKSWGPIVSDMNEEIIRLKVRISETPFNSDFSHTMQMVKIRTTELDSRLQTMVHEMKSEAACQRELINTWMAEFMREVRNLNTEITAIRALRAERSRANWLHVQELKKQGEEGDAETESINNKR